MAPKHDESEIIWIECAKSSNSLLKKEFSSLDNLAVIAVENQTAGRGQGDHSWYSSPGTNLTFSILFRFEPPLEASNAISITHICTLAICDYLKDKNINARIKWPNDIWVGEKKICGLLIENSLSNALILESIVGIGLNLNESLWPSSLPNPISLYELTGDKYDTHTELQVLVNFIRKRFFQLKTEKNSLKEEFDELVFKLD